LSSVIAAVWREANHHGDYIAYKKKKKTCFLATFTKLQNKQFVVRLEKIKGEVCNFGATNNHRIGKNKIIIITVLSKNSLSHQIHNYNVF